MLVYVIFLELMSKFNVFHCGIVCGQCEVNDIHMFHCLGGGSLPLVLCNHMCTRGIFMGVIYLLVWILGNPFKKKTTSPNIQHHVGIYKRKPILFKMMLNYL